MSTSRSSSSRTCPACGARNSGISLFCAECGATLNGDQDESGDTAAFDTTRATGHPTEPFGTSRGDRNGAFRWNDAPEPRPDETAPLPASRPRSAAHEPAQERWASPASGGTAAIPVASPYVDAAPTVAMVEAPEASARGFVLGLIACLLIAAVLGLYGWSAWLSADLRNTISGWFGFFG